MFNQGPKKKDENAALSDKWIFTIIRCGIGRKTAAADRIKFSIFNALKNLKIRPILAIFIPESDWTSAKRPIVVTAHSRGRRGGVGGRSRRRSVYIG